MGRNDTRLRQLSSDLTAKERAVLVMRSWRDGTEEEFSWRASMPSEQVHEFNRLIELMNGVARFLLPHAMLVPEREAQVSLRIALLSTLALWQIEATRTAEYIQFRTKEPVTESEYDERKRTAGDRFVHLGEALERLLERHDWPEADLDDGEDGERYVKGAAWLRERPNKLKELEALVRDGTLAGKGRGERLRVQAGPFYAWLGEPVPVHPERGLEFEVCPDSYEADVRARRKDREDAIESYDLAPHTPVVYIEGLAEAFDAVEEHRRPGKADELVAQLKATVHETLDEDWRRLGAIEAVFSEVGREFAGEEVAPPPLRHILDHCREKLEADYTEAERYLGPLERPEPRAEEIAELRDGVWRHVP